MDQTWLIVIGGAIYFLPSLVALLRRERTVRVILLNLLFGWSVLGWIFALVVALWPVRKSFRDRYVVVPYYGDVYDFDTAAAKSLVERGKR